MVDWSDIQLFEAVLREGSFSSAARVLGTTQATVSRRIKALEAEVGGALFVRGLEGVTLTPLGEALSGPAAAMAKAGASFERALGDQQRERRTIVLTCGELIGGFLSKHLGALHDGLEGVEIELRPTNAFVDLAKGEADLALRNVRPEKGQLKARKLKSEQYGAFSVFGAKDCFAKGQFKSATDVAKLNWIALARSMSHVPSTKWIAAHVPEEKIRFRMNSTALVLDATHGNEAVALLPRFIGLNESHLVEVYGPVEGLAFEMWIVRRDEGHDDPQMERLIANIEGVFA
ncbi:LysR family transcriptional regulator [Parvularcula sp. ZS-1/3]|uniref:LysR family transcriptional regulator n=1 Tax=Parvularcula mediterranea TaxID=2732508 RepID=A0A7Y3RJ17_9PROT|nr:LysR family transcriptional regulator [Parvularcula mediterranea]NNU14983.1 LysR family transcriptional regulator [Parvularcula mediterranea]